MKARHAARLMASVARELVEATNERLGRLHEASRCERRREIRERARLDELTKRTIRKAREAARAHAHGLGGEPFGRQQGGARIDAVEVFANPARELRATLRLT